MITFKKIKFHNFLSFKDQEFDLDNRGITLVLGQNNDSISAGSNGSGKSSLCGESLYYTLFGRTLRGIGPNEVTREGQTECSTELLFNIDDTEYKIIRGRKKSTGSLLIYENGKDISLKDVRQTQKEIIDKMFDADIVKNSLIFSGSVLESFVLLGDAQKKKMITSILGFDKIDLAKDIAKTKSVELGKVYDGSESKLALMKEQIEEYKTELKDVKKSNLSVLKKDIDRDKDTIEDLMQKQKDLTNKIVSYHKEVNDIDNDINKLKLTKGSIQNNIQNLKDQIRRKTRDKEEYQDLIKQGICPKCKEKIPEGGKLSEDVKEYDKEILKLEKQIKPNEDDVKKLQDGIEDLENQISDLGDIRDTEEEKSSIESELSDIRSNYETKFQEYKEIESMISNLTNQIQKHEQEIQKIEKQLVDVKEEKDIYDFWVEGFGSQGIVSYILDMYFPKFNTLLNEYLQVLFGSGVIARFVPYTQLKTGVLREKWDFEIEGLGNYQSCSSGERRRIDISVLLSLNSLVRDMLGGSNVLIVDEAFDPLDDSGTEKTIELLQKLDISSIFVITHNERLQERFENVIYVEKKNHISRVIE